MRVGLGRLRTPESVHLGLSRLAIPVRQRRHVALPAGQRRDQPVVQGASREAVDDRHDVPVSNEQVVHLNEQRCSLGGVEFGLRGAKQGIEFAAP